MKVFSANSTKLLDYKIIQNFMTRSVTINYSRKTKH